MRQSFPRKQKGDPLSHRHVNDLSRTASKIERLSPGSFRNLRHSGSNVSFSGTEPTHIFPITVSSLTTNSNDSEVSGKYLVNIRYYSFSDKIWKDNSKNWILDTRIEGGQGYLDTGDKIRAYWDTQRGAFVPVSLPELYWCMLMEDHPGRGLVFDVVVGVWHPSERKFRFDCDGTNLEKGIDWQYGVPHPDKYAQGWFKKKRSNTTDSGYIYFCVSMDCESDGVCSAEHGVETATDGILL